MYHCEVLQSVLVLNTYLLFFWFSHNVKSEALQPVCVCEREREREREIEL